MLNKDNIRELCYVVVIDNIEPIEGSDNCEAAIVGGWKIMVRKGTFKPGDLGVYFEIDSAVPHTEQYAFLEKKHYKIKTQKYTFGGKNPGFYSQGLLMSAEDFGWTVDRIDRLIITDDEMVRHIPGTESAFLTKKLGVTYADPDDNKRKSSSSGDKYKKMAGRHPKLFQNPIIKWIYKKTWGKKLLFVFFGKKKQDDSRFPKHFEYIHVTDQERCESMPWVLEDKTPYIVTQKADGSSGTYILEKKKKVFRTVYEFYVCSRNVHLNSPDQNTYHDKNYYWEVAEKYDIYIKLKDYMDKHPDLEYVCWQGEICAPSIQKNPQKVTETHFYCFHMIDSKIGKYDIRDAAKIWKEYNMEIVPIIDENYIMPDDFEEFKKSADGFYNPSICEGKDNCPREGFVYYKTTDPNFSFKNVSREYLANH